MHHLITSFELIAYLGNALIEASNLEHVRIALHCIYVVFLSSYLLWSQVGIWWRRALNELAKYSPKCTLHNLLVDLSSYFLLFLSKKWKEREFEKPPSIIKMQGVIVDRLAWLCNLNMTLPWYTTCGVIGPSWRLLSLVCILVACDIYLTWLFRRCLLGHFLWIGGNDLGRLNPWEFDPL